MADNFFPLLLLSLKMNDNNEAKTKKLKESENLIFSYN